MQFVHQRKFTVSIFGESAFKRELAEKGREKGKRERKKQRNMHRDLVSDRFEGLNFLLANPQKNET